jgi:diacylglycerol kinase family enzyme
MGGDGIVHTVAQALAQTSVRLAVLPAGTTNVFARLLGIPDKAVPAARLVTGAHRHQAVPLLRLHMGSGGVTSTRWAVFSAGFGYDAEVVARAEAEPYRKYWFGGLHYARSALKVAFSDIRGRPSNLRIHAGDRKADGIALMAQFREVYTYFGKFPLRFERAVPQPLTLLVVKELPRRRIPAIVNRLLNNGEVATLPGFEAWPNIESARLEADPPVLGQADGELLGPVEWAELSVAADALRVVVPLTPSEGSLSDRG